jgi:hypothetical protein
MIPSTLDQTPWMRKKRLQSTVGYAIMHVTLDEYGGVSSFLPELKTFFDRNYYSKKWEFIW